MRPLSDRLVVEVLEEGSGKMSATGMLHIPDTAQDKSQRGLVVAVGLGRYDAGVLVPMDVKVDDEVIFGKYAGTKLEFNDEEVLVLRESDILLVV